MPPRSVPVEQGPSRSSFCHGAAGLPPANPNPSLATLWPELGKTAWHLQKTVPLADVSIALKTIDACYKQSQRKTGGPLCTVPPLPCPPRAGLGPTPHAPGSSPDPAEGAVLLWAPAAPYMFPMDREQLPRPPLSPGGAGAARAQDAGGQEATGFLSSRSEVNAHTLQLL